MKLIDKAAVVAEIEGIEYETNYEPFTDEVLGKRKVCKDIKEFLDTLEVKEVDLGKEIEKCLKQYHMLAVGKKDFAPIAKYFFELGLKAAQKGE